MARSKSDDAGDHREVDDQRCERYNGAEHLSAISPHGRGETPGLRRGQNAVTPFGVPRPVGPSYPTSEVHRYAGLQLPLLPRAMSKSAPVCAYGSEPKVTEPPLTPYT